MSARIVAMAAVFTVLTLGGAAAEEPVTFSLALEQGTFFTTEQSFDWSITVPMRGPMSIKGRMEYEYYVESVQDGAFTIEATCKKVTMDFSMPNMDMSYDSSKKEDKDKESHPLIASYAMAGMSYTFTLNERGEAVGEVKGLEEMKKKLLGRLAEGDMQAMQARMAVEKRFRQEAVKEEIEALFKVPSTEPRKPGDSWDNPSSAFAIPMMGTMGMKDRTLTLEKVEAGVAVLQQKAKLEMPKGDAGNMGAMMAMFAMKKNDFSASSKFDLEKKMPWESRFSVDLTLEPQQQMPGMEGMGEMTIAIQGKMSWEIKTFKRSE